MQPSKKESSCDRHAFLHVCATPLLWHYGMARRSELPSGSANVDAPCHVQDEVIPNIPRGSPTQMHTGNSWVAPLRPVQPLYALYVDSLRTALAAAGNTVVGRFSNMSRTSGHCFVFQSM